jgi:excinuclease ABC subunit B
VILYADKRTQSIEGALAEMERRRSRQRAHNEEHGVVPTTIVKAVRDLLEPLPDAEGELELPAPKKGRRGRERGRPAAAVPAGGPVRRQFADHRDLLQHTKMLRAEMMAAAKNLDFELAARIRDEVYRLEKLDMELL